MSSLPAGPADVHQCLAEVLDPEIGRPLVRNDQVRDIAIAGSTLRLTLALTTWSAPLWKQIQADVIELLRARFSGLGEIEITLQPHRRPPQKLGQIGLAAKSVIAVGSGKGGVGKSTLAASIAIGLSRFGSQVGLMDADVYGPSIPHLVGSSERPQATPARRLLPIEAAGLRTISIGYLVPPGEAVVWRGPMLHGAITQFLRDVEWGELDYLIIDMPPGTGDIALTLSQLLPLTGAVVVCTPQDVALLDAVKAIAMFRKVNIPVLGMVENMSYFLCPDNGKRYDIFGHGGAQAKARELDIPFLGEVPIQIPIRQHGDAGQVGQCLEDPAIAPFFQAVCVNLVRNIAQRNQSAPPLPALPVL